MDPLDRNSPRRRDEIDRECSTNAVDFDSIAIAIGIAIVIAIPDRMNHL